MSCSKPVTLKITDRYGVQHYPTDITGRPIAFPCGYCIGCKTDKINMWTKRLTYEFNGRSSSFVALTYDDLHSFYNRGFYEKSLNRKDLHEFIDNFRHYLRNHYSHLTDSLHFKYFAVGEYGGQNGRPHYHVLMLGIPPAMANMIIPKLWKKGSCDAKPMFRGSISYVLKYMSKQQNKDYNRQHFEVFGLTPPFISCSPGIGAEFFMAHQDEIRRYGYVKDGARNIPVPNYWKNKIFCMAPCKHYIDSQIEYKKCLNDEHDNFAKAHNYYSYDDFILEQARITEKNMVIECRNQGIPVDDYTNFGHRSYRVPKYYDLQKHYKTMQKIASEVLDNY